MNELQRLSLAWCVGLPFVTVGLLATPVGYSFPFVMLGLPALFFCWLVAGLSAISSALHAARVRAWPQVGLFVAVAAFIGVAASDPLRLSRFCFFVSNGVNVAVMAPIYNFEISLLPNADRNLVVFNRGGMIWASGGVVYDATDESMLPTTQRSGEWLDEASRNEMACEPQVQHLWGHWYAGSFSC